MLRLMRWLVSLGCFLGKLAFDFLVVAVVRCPAVGYSWRLAVSWSLVVMHQVQVCYLESYCYLCFGRKMRWLDLVFCRHQRQREFCGARRDHSIGSVLVSQIVWSKKNVRGKKFAADRKHTCLAHLNPQLLQRSRFPLGPRLHSGVTRV